MLPTAWPTELCGHALQAKHRPVCAMLVANPHSAGVRPAMHALVPPRHGHTQVCASSAMVTRGYVTCVLDSR